jgi:phenolic acid decarboxylase
MASPEYHRIRDIIASRLVQSDRPVNVKKQRLEIYQVKWSAPRSTPPEFQRRCRHHPERLTTP